VRIVLDTNVLVSGIFWSGVPFKILEYWIQEKYKALITEPILLEYEATLNRISKGKKDDLINSWILFIVENGIVIDVKKKFNLSIDPDDNKFIDCAVSGNAQYIVSGDAHLLDLRTVLDIQIIKPNTFFKLLK
jgi:putative PIN family toxin of toxin-antitoxin system